MIKDSYERLAMDVTEFDAEDIITASIPEFSPTGMEMTDKGEANSSGVYPVGF